MGKEEDSSKYEYILNGFAGFVSSASVEDLRCFMTLLNRAIDIKRALTAAMPEEGAGYARMKIEIEGVTRSASITFGVEDKPKQVLAESVEEALQAILELKLEELRDFMEKVLSS